MTQQHHFDRGRAATHDDESGATASEYAIVASLIAVVIVAAVTLIGSEVAEMFNNVDLQAALTLS